MEILEQMHFVALFGAVAPLTFTLWQMTQQELKRQAEEQEADQKRERRDRLEVVSFSLNSWVRSETEQGAAGTVGAGASGASRHGRRDALANPSSFEYNTLFELSLENLLSTQARSQELVASIKEAAKHTTPEHPILHTLKPKDWQDMRGLLLNRLSEQYASGYLAKELGIETSEKKYYFAFVNERPKAGAKKDATTMKLRVVIASEDMLKDIAASPPTSGLTSPFGARADVRANTLRNMSALLKDKRDGTRRDAIDETRAAQ